MEEWIVEVHRRVEVPNGMTDLVESHIETERVTVQAESAIKALKRASPEKYDHDLTLWLAGAERVTVTVALVEPEYTREE